MKLHEKTTQSLTFLLKVRPFLEVRLPEFYTEINYVITELDGDRISNL